MKRLSLLFSSLLMSGLLYAQDGISFEPNFNTDWNTMSTAQYPEAPIKTQILFTGRVDTVQTTDHYGKANGEAIAKENHDFIGISPDGVNAYRISVNHERTDRNDETGDGGGMTTFKVVRNDDGEFNLVETELEDGRKGKFHNVDFENTVGVTWTNCGGIISPDGRIWTAEEYPKTKAQGNNSVKGFLKDTGDVVVGKGKLVHFINDSAQVLTGHTLKAYENQGWMVEIDPKSGKAIRKQYNWGRMSFEAGCMMPDNKTIYLAEDLRPGMFTKFVADKAGDFTTGSLYVYDQKDTHGADGHWIKMDNSAIREMVELSDSAYKRGATMFIRLEWVTEIDGKVYICETGYDNVCKDKNWVSRHNLGGEYAQHHQDRATAQGALLDTTGQAGAIPYADYYGRVLVFDPATDEMNVFLAGGPEYDTKESQAIADYPSVHLSNPDGLGKVNINGKSFMIINEDLNGTSYNRVPAEAIASGFKACEMYMLDMSIENPTLNDLIRIGVGPKGSELTGGNGTQDGKTILVDIQHPSGSNQAPYNHAATMAMVGWDNLFNSENFTQETDGMGAFSAISVSGDQNWAWESYGNGCAKMTGYTDAANANEDWLVAEVDLTNISKPVFYFTQAYKLYGADATTDLNVMVSDDFNGTDVAAANWTELTITNRPTGNDWDFIKSDTIDLSAYAGKTITIGFQYLSSTALASTWEISSANVIETDIAFDIDWENHTKYQTVNHPAIKTQVLFSGTVDTVTIVDSYGKPAGFAPAKENHDFIGITPDADGYWFSINHERTDRNPLVGDGGGMTSFKAVYEADSLKVIETVLPDGRTGLYHNVDFANTVGVTWTNCGGIIAPDGRIWTAEEYPKTKAQGNNSVKGFLADTADVIIGTGVLYPFNNDSVQVLTGNTLKAYQNQGWMVEINPKTGKAIRKQYNWGRMSFEAGCIMPDNKTVYLAEDLRPGMFTKFVADKAGDFTTGNLYVYDQKDTHGTDGHWIKMDNSNMAEMVELSDSAYKRGATMFIRLEWLTEIDGKVYICETGYDNVCKDKNWVARHNLGGEYATHHQMRATAQGALLDTTGQAGAKPYADYYGRILVFDPATDQISTYLEGGPEYTEKQSQEISAYPAKHLSNPDGLGKITVHGKNYLIINEDLNGTSYNRVPSEAIVSGFKACEMYLLDMSIANPTVNDLARIMVGPKGSELTGGNGTPDGKTILVDIQHPSTSNEAAYKYACTVALHGWDDIKANIEEVKVENQKSFIEAIDYITKTVYFTSNFDIEIYNMQGQNVLSRTATTRVNMYNLPQGTYIIRNSAGQTAKVLNR